MSLITRRQVLSSLLIIFRVAQRRAWTRETVTMHEAMTKIPFSAAVSKVLSEEGEPLGQETLVLVPLGCGKGDVPNREEFGSPSCPPP